MPARHGNTNTNRDAGFTLVEVAIVLVVIGLLVGGILVGRDLIRTAEIRSVMSQVESYQAAVNTFKLKFNAIPGDMPSADAVQWGFQARAGGNGDGRVTSANCNFCVDVETECFWMDLAKANLIKNALNNNCGGPPPAVVYGMSALSAYLPPTKALNAIVAVGYFNSPINQLEYINNTHYFYVGTVASIDDSGGTLEGLIGGISDYDASLNNPPVLFLPREMYGIDAKYDDGLPRGGRVRYGAPSAGDIVPVPFANAPSRCTDGTDATGSRYYVANTQASCNMMIQAGF
jgi:prepilin-type N-terminal cleavage/methylation domain-containing protein